MRAVARCVYAPVLNVCRLEGAKRGCVPQLCSTGWAWGMSVCVHCESFTKKFLRNWEKIV